MINYIKNEAIVELNNYIKTINDDDIDYYLFDSKKSVDKYIFSGNFNYNSLLKKYIIKINEFLEYNSDNEFIQIDDDKKQWNICIINEELFFQNMFILKNIIFINISKIMEIYDIYIKYQKLDNVFIDKLMKLKLYSIQYYNFYNCKNYIEKNNNCKFIKKNNFILNNELLILKDINTSFLDEYYCVFGEKFEYIIVKNIIKNNIKYLPYYEYSVIKVNENIIDFDEIIGIDLFEFFNNYFEEYNNIIIKSIIYY